MAELGRAWHLWIPPKHPLWLVDYADNECGIAVRTLPAESLLPRLMAGVTDGGAHLHPCRLGAARLRQKLCQAALS